MGLFFFSLFQFLVSPLFVIEILHRAVDIFEDYFNECNESSLKENFVIVYEVGTVRIFKLDLTRVC